MEEKYDSLPPGANEETKFSFISQYSFTLTDTVIYLFISTFQGCRSIAPLKCSNGQWALLAVASNLSRSVS